MAEVREVKLPGVGVRLEFDTAAGEQVAVVVHRGGRRELMVYDSDDPDICTTVMHLTPSEARTLSEALGGSTVTEVSRVVEQRIEGLAIDWVEVADDSSFADRSIADGMFRTRTGVSVVAVIRGSETVAAPGPDFVFTSGDVAVVVGTPAGIDQVRTLLSS
ncbi:MAG: cation:proton antiporter regulatory subunit [Acidimicrobiia bacterium]|nr:cation:proton antiporter regulatory subunit [Acidimicrobiia bacterium]